MQPEKQQEQEASSRSKANKDVVWRPTRVYPMKVEEGELPPGYDFDRAKQIAVHKDSSFMVTDEGALFSWG